MSCISTVFAAIFKRLMILSATLASTLLLQSCAVSYGAKPWEREYLADRQMLIDPASLEQRNLEHIYFSREGSTGGWGVGGGGCGCN